MRKFSLIFIFLGLGFSSSYCQTWYPLGKGLQNGTYNNCVAIEAYNNRIFAGGWFDSAGNDLSGGIAQWNDTTWAGVDNGVDGRFSYPSEAVTAFAVYNGELYVGGRFDTAGGVFTLYIAKWNGASWSTVGSGILGIVNALQVYNGNLYAGGQFTVAGSAPAYNIAMWNGSNWSKVGNKGVSIHWAINAMTVYNGKLYVGGSFDSAGGLPANNIASWDGIAWDTLGKGISYSLSKEIDALCPFNGKLYAGGLFDSAGGQKVNNIASWDGINWNPVGNGVRNGNVYALTTYGTQIIIGGSFDSSGGVPIKYINAFDGANWSSLGSGVNGTVNALYVYNGCVYTGGSFQQAGGKSAINIAKWVSPAGINELKPNQTISVFPNPFNNSTTVAVNTEGKHYLELNDITGRKLQTIEFTGKQYVLSAQGLAKGMYFVRVFDDQNALIGTSKIVVE